MDVTELKIASAEGDAVEQMTRTDGWKILEGHFRQQLEMYKNDIIQNCNSWEEYLDKRAKVHAMSLFLTDVEEFMSQGELAKEDLKKLLPDT